MKKLSLVLVALALLLALLPAGMAQAEKPAPSLTATIDYDFVGHLGQFDAEGRLLVWEVDLSGDIEGVAFWWFEWPLQVTGKVNHYVAYFEIYDESGQVLLLAGYDFGTTAKPPGREDDIWIWRGVGMVTEAYGVFEDWNGRRVYGSGPVITTFPYTGTGILRIN